MAFTQNKYNDFLYLTIDSFTETGLISHGFTSRLGGVSKPPLDSMNLGLGRGDSHSAVMENYEIAGRAIGFDARRLVFFPQVHKSDIFVATAADAGFGFRKERPSFDGIITNVKNLPLATFHADCTPIFLLDPIKEVVGVVHAGWRGTALKTVQAAILKMHDAYSSRPSDILAGIGPCCGICCYENDYDVPSAMLDAYGDVAKEYFIPRGSKWHTDLAGLNRHALIEVGLLPENITMSDICTCCNSDTYWSHRKTNGIRGAMAAIIMLR